jgi:hypothetical protein
VTFKGGVNYFLKDSSYNGKNDDGTTIVNFNGQNENWGKYDVFVKPGF